MFRGGDLWGWLWAASKWQHELHETFTSFCVNVGPVSKTMGQHSHSIGPTPCVFCGRNAVQSVTNWNVTKRIFRKRWHEYSGQRWTSHCSLRDESAVPYGKAFVHKCYKLIESSCRPRSNKFPIDTLFIEMSLTIVALIDNAFHRHGWHFLSIHSLQLRLGFFKKSCYIVT